MTIIKFGAEWCTPCREFEPVFHEIEQEMNGRADFETYDVDQDVEKAFEFGIFAIPTVVFVENGQELGRFSGFSPKEDFRTRVEHYLGA